MGVVHHVQPSAVMRNLLDSIPPATPGALLAARQAAGHSQADAAAACGLASHYRWSEYERGVRQIDQARWALYLLATGQHPTYRAVPL